MIEIFCPLSVKLIRTTGVHLDAAIVWSSCHFRPEKTQISRGRSQRNRFLFVNVVKYVCDKTGLFAIFADLRLGKQILSCFLEVILFERIYTKVKNVEWGIWWLVLEFVWCYPTEILMITSCICPNLVLVSMHSQEAQILPRIGQSCWISSIVRWKTVEDTMMSVRWDVCMQYSSS